MPVLDAPETSWNPPWLLGSRELCWVTNWAEPNSLKCSLRPGGPWRPTCSSWCSKPQTSGDREHGDPMGNDNVRWHPISEGWNGWNMMEKYENQQSNCDQLEILIHVGSSWLDGLNGWETQTKLVESDRETRSKTLYSSESMRFDLAFVGLPLGYYLAYMLSVSLCTSIEIRAPFLDAVPIEIIFLCSDLFHHGCRVGHGVAGGRALSHTICTLLSWLRTHKCWRDTQVSVLVYFDEMISHMAPPKSHESGDFFRD